MKFEIKVRFQMILSQCCGSFTEDIALKLMQSATLMKQK
jgi:hypothetical protein